MNRKVTIEFYKKIGRLTLYTLRFEGSDQNETDAFFARFQAKPEYKGDLEIIGAVFKRFSKRGVEDRYLRGEDSASALPIEESNLRLYCFKGHKYCLILGGGGIKSSQLVEDSPDAYPHFKHIKAIEKAFREAIMERDMEWDEDRLTGDLNLQIDT